jgi:predicted  nucleic acid-binding Zn-ribbon protein
MSIFNLSGLKSAISSVKSHIAAVQKSLARAQAEKHELETAPINRDDLVKAINAYIDHESARAEKLVIECLSHYSSFPLQKYREQIEGSPNAPRLKIINAITPGRTDDDHFFLQATIFFLAGDLLKERMAKLIKARWPETVSQSVNTRISRIAELDKEIKRLETEEGEIQKAAVESGVRIQGTKPAIKTIQRGRQIEHIED